MKVRTPLSAAAMEPDEGGRYGVYGGRYAPETLMAPLEELSRAWDRLRRKRTFQRRLNHLLEHYVGRPTPLYFAERLTEHLGGARIYLKREDLNHTGAHKINNTVGQALLAKEHEQVPHHRGDGGRPARGGQCHDRCGAPGA